MAKSADQPSEFVRCAEAVDRELRRLEELSRSARNVRLSSEKGIERAARGLEQAFSQQERVGQELRSLGQAMVAMEARQQAAVNALAVRAGEIQARMARLSEHMQLFGALGAKAAEAATALHEISAAAGDGGRSGGASALFDADERIRGLAEQAQSVAKAAGADEFPDIAREAHALGQQIQAMRERLSELLRAQSVGAS
jgi:chromosome segregation ATPase